MTITHTPSRRAWLVVSTIAVLSLFPLMPLRPSPVSAAPAEARDAALAIDLALPATEIVRASTPVAVDPREHVHVELYDVNGETTLAVDLPTDGVVDEETSAKLAHFFRCRRRGREKPMSPGVLALLADVAKTFPGHTIEIISGYRSPPYGARKSKHFRGNAIDLRVRGVRLSRVRDAMWASHTGIGLGWYPEQNFIHIDYRPGERDTSWSAKGEGAPYRYHPYWAEKARARAAAVESR